MDLETFLAGSSGDASASVQGAMHTIRHLRAPALVRCSSLERAAGSPVSPLRNRSNQGSKRPHQQGCTDAAASKRDIPAELEPSLAPLRAPCSC